MYQRANYLVWIHVKFINISVKLDIDREMNIYVIENQYDSVVDLLNVYALNRDVRIKPYVELITPFAWFDKKIV